MPRRASFQFSLSLSLSLPNRSSRFSLSLSLSIYIYIYDTLYIYEELSLFAQTRFSKAANTNNEDVKCFPKTPRSFLLKLPFFREIFPQTRSSQVHKTMSYYERIRLALMKKSTFTL